MKDKFRDLKEFYDIKSKQILFETNAGASCSCGACSGSCGDCSCCDGSGCGV